MIHTTNHNVYSVYLDAWEKPWSFKSILGIKKSAKASLALAV